MTEPYLIETNVSLVPNVGDEQAVKYSQIITDDYLQSIQDRHTGINDVTGNFLFVGSVPAGLVDRWLREGYDVYKEPIRKTLAKLKAENFGRFVATSKSI
jgi:hypothetical protein